MDTCTNCVLIYEQSNINSHELRNNHLSSTNKYYCQQHKSLINRADDCSIYNPANMKLLEEEDIAIYLMKT